MRIREFYSFILFRQMPIRYLFKKVVVSTPTHGVISILGCCVSSHGLFLLCGKDCDTLALSSVISQDHVFLP